MKQLGGLWLASADQQAALLTTLDTIVCVTPAAAKSATCQTAARVCTGSLPPVVLVWASLLTTPVPFPHVCVRFTALDLPDQQVRTGPVCEGMIPKLQCRASLIIKVIDSAFYGRSDTSTCPYRDAGAIRNTACSAAGYKAAVEGRCLGKGSCTVPGDAVPDPCYGTFKWASVTFTCGAPPGVVREAFSWQEVAPHQSSTGHDVLHAWHSADYYRYTQATRHTEVYTAVNTVAAISMYTQLKLSTITTELSLSFTHAELLKVGPVCENAQLPMVLQCPTGQVVTQVTSAFFGRSDATTCPYRDPRAMANTACSSTVYLEIVRQWCYGQASCSMGGVPGIPDPCVGTFKWTEATYSCAEPAVLPRCTGTMSCLGPVFDSSILPVNPDTLVGGQAVNVAGKGGLFSAFGAGDLANIAQAAVRNPVCPLPVLTGAQITQLGQFAATATSISGLFPTALGSAAMACKHLSLMAKLDARYILGAAAWVSVVGMRPCIRCAGLRRRVITHARARCCCLFLVYVSLRWVPRQ